MAQPRWLAPWKDDPRSPAIYHVSDKNFRPATTYFGSLFVGHALTKQVSASLALSIAHGTRDRFLGDRIAFTGSTTLAIKPTLIWDLNEQYSASASLSLPIWQRVNTTQLAAGPLWTLGMSYHF